MTFKDVKHSVLQLFKDYADYIGIPENRITIDTVNINIAPSIALHFRVVESNEISEDGISGWLACLVAYIGTPRRSLSEAQDDAMEVIARINRLLLERGDDLIMKWTNVVEPVAFDTAEDGTPILKPERPITGTQFLFKYNPIGEWNE